MRDLEKVMQEYADHFELELRKEEDYDEWVVTNTKTGDKVFILEEGENDFAIYVLMRAYGFDNLSDLHQIDRVFDWETAVKSAVSAAAQYDKDF